MKPVSLGARLAPLGWGVLTTAVVAVPGLIVRGVDAAYDGDLEYTRLSPEFRWVALASALLVVLSLGVSFTLVIHRFDALRPRSTVGRVAYVGGTLFAHLLAVGATLVTLLLVGLRIFGPSYQSVSARAPDGHATAYLYSQSLICGYMVMTRKPGALLVRRDHDIDMKCADKPRRPRLVWSDDSREVRVTDEDGAPVKSTSFDFWLGPH
jgi:cytochrome bd-type quinol oxidase subunit 2